MDGWMDRWKPWKYPSTDQSKFYHLEDEIYTKVIKTFPKKKKKRLFLLGWDIGNLYMPQVDLF